MRQTDETGRHHNVNGEFHMGKEVVERWMPSDLGEMIEALQEVRQMARASGQDIAAVYVDVRDLALIEETLTDGSKVMNLVVRENR